MSPKILKSKSNQDDMDFVGVYVPQHISNYITLCMLATEVNKSNLLRAILDGWYKLSCGEHSEDQLLQQITARVQKEWKVEKTIHPNYQSFLYRKKLQKELEKRGLADTQIQIILNDIN